MSFMHADKITESSNPEVQLRSCLMCAIKFVSLWAGNRVCKKCQSRSLWKQGC